MEAKAPLPTAEAPRDYAVEFTAKAGEYFRIWIVNLALTILTLGIYSAWAKVRRKRYFYASTLVDGDAFEYRGNPIAILKGRVLAVVVTAVVYGVGHFAPAYLLAAIPIALFGVPWLIVRSFAFNAYNSAYRNIRFHFHGGYWPCWRLIFGYGLLTVVTFGLGYFYLKTRLTEFIIRNHAYGGTPFEVPDLKKPYFSIYGKAIGLGFLSGVLAAACMMALLLLMGTEDAVDSPFFDAFNFVVYFFYLGVFAYVRSRILNATWNLSTLGSLRFRCTLRARTLWGLYITNILAIIATLGLATPWAVVRTLRYRARNLVLVSQGDLAGFVKGQGSVIGAAGEEVGEMLDFDFSL